MHLRQVRSVFSVSLSEDKSFKSIDLKTESLIRTDCDSEFQTDGAENRKGRLEKYDLVNGWTSSGMADERKVRLQTRSVIRPCG